MLYIRGHLGRKILVQGSAKEHIHHLDTPADTQNGQIPVHCQVAHPTLRIIPLGGEGNRIVPDFFLIQTGIQISTAGEQDAVAQLNQCFQFLHAPFRRQDQGNAAKMPDGVQVAVVQENPIQLFILFIAAG